MQFNDAMLCAALKGWTASPDLRSRAEAHNVGFDEHVSDPRRATIESDLTHVRDANEMRRALIDYYCERVRVSTGIPIPFLPENSAASSGTISDEQKLVRLEDLRERSLN